MRPAVSALPIPIDVRVGGLLLANMLVAWLDDDPKVSSAGEASHEFQDHRTPPEPTSLRVFTPVDPQPSPPPSGEHGASVCTAPEGAGTGLDGISQAGQIEVQIHWRSGTVTSVSVKRPAPGEGSLKTPDEAVSKIHEMAPRSGYEEIAARLNRTGLRSAFGRRFTTQHVGYICRRDGLAPGQRHSGSKPKKNSPKGSTRS